MDTAVRILRGGETLIQACQNVRDESIPVLNQRSKILPQPFQQLRLVQTGAVVAFLGGILVVGNAPPIDPRVCIGIALSRKGAPAMRALDQRGKGMLGAVSARHKRLAGIVLSAPGRHDFLGFPKRLRRDDRPGGATVTELFLLGKPDLPAGEKILNFVFVIYQNPAVNGIHQNPANATGVPVAAKLGFIPIAVEGCADGRCRGKKSCGQFRLRRG